jgi:hypothetical protein
MVASRAKIIFLPDGSTSPGNYGLLFVYERDVKKFSHGYTTSSK